MSSGLLRKLDLALEPVYPSLVLSIEPGKLEVDATVVAGAEPFEPVATFALAPSVAQVYACKTSHFVVAGDSVELDAFLQALLQMPLPIATDPTPTCSVADVADFISSELQLTETVLVQIGDAKWRVIA